MTTFTVTTAVNIDTLTPKAGGDTYNINGGYLTIDQDSRYGVNQNTSASWGPVTLSATLGGTIEINSTLVRLIPYNTGTGNVPALGTTISSGGASAVLLGVYANLASAPTTAGSAMPASGYIKVRQWNSVAYAAGALTGIGATATGADVPGWLEIVGDEAGLCTVNRLNLFKVRGDYFQLGTTDGVRATTYQIPSHNTLQYHAGVEVETGSGTGVYEFYPCAGSLTATAANISTDSVRGKVCWISTAGLLRFGHDGTNSTGGYIPPAGRKVRIANIFFANCTTAARTANVLPNATLATRYEFSTSGGGVLDIDKASIGWYMNINQPFSVAMTNVGILTALVATEIASPIAWSNVNVGQEAANTQLALSMSLCFAGGTMTNCKFVRAAQAASGAYVVSMSDCSGFTFTNNTAASLVKAANATTGSCTYIRLSNCTWNGTILGGGRMYFTTCTDVVVNNTVYYDRPSGNTTSSTAMYAFQVGTNCLNCTFDGLSFGGLSLVQPYTGILGLDTAGCTNIKLRNLGTYASPLDMGGPYVDCTWTRSTTTMTITKVGHGLATNDLIAMHVISDVTPKAVTTTTATLWTVASTPTADTFTVTVANSGATSGTGSYFPCMTGLLVGIAVSGAANNVMIQRCYTPHLRVGVFSGDNSTKNVTVESVVGTDWGVQLVPHLNATIRMLTSTPALTAQTSCYGTHWIDYYTTGIPPNTASVSWSRTSTTATITSVGHLMRTGDLINVTVTSDSGAIVLGRKTITATTSGAFTFTCLNAGATSGTLTFVPLNGRVAVQMNEATADTTSHVTLANGAAFTSAGGLYMPTVGHQATFETPNYLVGHSSFPIAEAIMAGGTLANYAVLYSIDTGSGYSAYKNLAYTRAGGGGSGGSTNVTMTSTTGVSAGDYVWGTNIAPNAKVVSITDGTTVVVDLANIGTVSGVLRFNQLPSEPEVPSTGFKMRIKVTTSTTNAAAITSLAFCTRSTSTSRALTYVLDTTVMTLSGLATGTEITVYEAGTETELAAVEDSTDTFVFSVASGSSIDIRIHNVSYYSADIMAYTVPYQATTIPIQQRLDPNYVNN